MFFQFPPQPWLSRTDVMVDDWTDHSVDGVKAFYQVIKGKECHLSSF